MNSMIQIEHIKPKKYKKFFEFIIETGKIILLSLAIIIPVRYFLIQPFYVKGASMEPNFHDNEYLIVDEISYRLHEPKRGDIVVFRYPKDQSKYFIKRVIGLPNEKIEIKDNKIFIYNKDHPAGVIIDEKKYLSDLKADKIINIVTELKNDEYFVMGDNRDNSLDSRFFGPIKKEYFIGKTLLRGWPLAEISLFETLEYDSLN